MVSINLRGKHFERPDTPPTIEITDRDLDILYHVLTLRLASSEQLAKLVPGTRQKVAERLRRLFEAGLLDKPRRQLDRRTMAGGGTAHVYAISKAGARVLVEERRAEDIDDLDWTRKNKRAGRQFIRHTTAIADIAIALSRAAANRLNYAVVQHNALVQTLPDKTRASDNPWKWGRVTLPPNYAVTGPAASMSNIPDHAAVVVLPDGTRRAFLIEIDRGTMPVERANFFQNSLIKKVIGYHYGNRLKLHQSLFGWKGLRFLIVTTTPTRVDNILDAIKRKPDLYRDTKGEHFWVTDKASLDASSDIFTHAWRCADGATKTIIPTTP